VSTLRGNDTIDVNVGDTVSAALFVDGGHPTTVNKGNEQLNLYDKSVGWKGVYSKFLAAAPLAQGQLCLRSRQMSGDVPGLRQNRKADAEMTKA
jgi:hypothetical protein